MKSFSSLFMIAAFCVTGCGGSSHGGVRMIKYAVEYNSTPESAVVICNNEQKGYTPLKLYYKVRSDASIVSTGPCKAVWRSGVEVPYQTEISRFQANKKARLFATHPGGREQSEDIEFDYRRKQDERNFQQKKESDEETNQILQAIPAMILPWLL